MLKQKLIDEKTLMNFRATYDESVGSSSGEQTALAMRRSLPEEPQSQEGQVAQTEE